MKNEKYFFLNYYAVELLESVDFGPPSQNMIDKVEKLLKQEGVTIENNRYLRELIVYDFPEKKALLIENDFLLQKAHTILLSNMGFRVVLVSSVEKALTSLSNAYDIVVGKLNKKEIEMIKSQANTSKIFVYLTAEEIEKKAKDEFVGDKLLELPLSVDKLYETFLEHNL